MRKKKEQSADEIECRAIFKLQGKVVLVDKSATKTGKYVVGMLAKLCAFIDDRRCICMWYSIEFSDDKQDAQRVHGVTLHNENAALKNLKVLDIKRKDYIKRALAAEGKSQEEYVKLIKELV